MSHFSYLLFHFRQVTAKLNIESPVLYYCKGIVLCVFLLHNFRTTAQTPDAQGIVYVSPTGTGDGSAWNNATSDLHNAIHATGVQKVFVTIGTYKVGSQSFVMKSGVEIYGGFDPANGIDDLTDNRILPNKGMGDGSVLDGENARPVIWNYENGVNTTAVLDGFTVTNGNADFGGGIYNNSASPTLRNMVFRNNTSTFSGGAMFNANSSSPVINNVTVSANTAGADGGGICNIGSSSPVMSYVTISNNSANYAGGVFNRDHSSPRMENCHVTDNTATEDGGGIYNDSYSSPPLINTVIADNSAKNGAGMYNRNNSSPILTNVLITGNTAVTNGAAIRNESSSSPTLTNVTIVGNIGSDALYATDGASILANTIVYGEITEAYTAQYSLIEGNSNTDNHNLDASGLTLAHIFTDPGAGDFTLKVGSPAINAGDNTLIPSGITTDLAGNARIQLGAVDLGAYEVALFPDAQGIVYVTPTGTGNGSAWNNATADLHNAIHASGVQKVFVAIGIYKVGDHSFVMKSGVEIYGGFDPENGIDDLTDNRILPNKGMGDGSVLDGENQRPVIWNNNNGVDPTAVLDGFTVTKGYSEYGGGIYTNLASPTFRNLMVRGNRGTLGGGGMYNGRSAHTIVTDCIFASNSTSETGGGIQNSGSPGNISNPVYTNCIIRENVARSSAGIYSVYTAAHFINCLVINNIVEQPTIYNNGVFIESTYGTVRIINTTIAGNVGKTGLQAVGTGYLYNSIVWDPTSGPFTAINSLVFGKNVSSDGNISATELAATDIFTDPSAGDYTLKSGSPAVDAGDEFWYDGLTENTKDLAGNARLYQFNAGQIDLGPYESTHHAYTYNPVTPDVNGIVYIKATATGDKSGSSWANAGDNFRIAVRLAGVQQVWVATGVYPASKVRMRNNLAIFGGFDPDNGIDDLTDNRILPNPGTGIEGSVLDGENTRSVIINSNNGVTGTAILDGFTLTNGHASHGAGVHNNAASPTLRNLWIKGNTATSNGGGMYNTSSSAPIMTNITISNNTAAADGGGIFNIGSSSPVMTNVTVSDNTAIYAGGLFNRDHSSPRMENCRVSDNTATEDGGGMYNDNNASPVLTNTLINGNSAKNGAGIYNRTSSSPLLTNVLLTGNTAVTNGGAIRNETNSSPTLTNVTIAGNTGANAVYATNGASVLANTIVYGGITGSYTAQYSLIEGNSSTDNHNLNATGVTLNHIFTDPGAGDFTLKVGSPAINTGDNTLVPSGITTDLAGNARIRLGAVDLGAYEVALFPDGQGIVYVTPSGTGNGSAWKNATADLHNAIHASGVQKVFVAIGTYKVGDHSFIMKSGVEIYGGFDPDNGIDDLTDKRILPNKGMGDGSVLDGEDVRPVIWNVDNGVDLTAILDGFTITKGYNAQAGGGIYNKDASPTLRNLVVRNNRTLTGGAGIYNGPNTSPAVSECIFTLNTSPNLGAVYNFSGATSTTTFTNCIIEKNHAYRGTSAL